jgi:hypothetical protein
LTYILNVRPEEDYFPETRIVVEQDGALHYPGDIQLKGDQDSERLLPDADHYTLCRCEGSKK